ncbi:unnamed protein product [Amaranthus hypochondriacus]
MNDDHIESSNIVLDLVVPQEIPKKNQVSCVGTQGRLNHRVTGRTQSPTRTQQQHDPQTSNYYAVLSDDGNGNQNVGRSQSRLLPIKALGAYPIDDHE